MRQHFSGEYGPFSTQRMRRWLHSGFFSRRLRVRFGLQQGPFIPIDELFGDMEAFEAQEPRADLFYYGTQLRNNLDGS